MSLSYKLQKKKNPQRRDDPAKWYAVPKNGTPMDEKSMTRSATESTTVEDVELLASSRLISKHIRNELLAGKRVRIPYIGSFRLSFGSDGVDDIRDFHTGLIRNIKIVFTPDADLRTDILRDVKFENAGVDDEGVYYGSLENYKMVKGLNQGGSGGGSTGEGEDGGGESPDPIV